ncbi:MAG: TerB family tellurite resistance protein [Gemmataceae bacterium]|nr:TerB family tellurite resistance protein [Gemmataceae bacterium]
MNFHALASLLIILLHLAILAVIIAYFYYRNRFHKSFELSWRNRILARYQELQNSYAKLQIPIPPVDALIQRERENAFDRYLSRFKVDELIRYQGIGPKTVELLQASGYARMNQLNARGIEFQLQNISGIGSSKSLDIVSAVFDFVRAKKAEFDAGQCPEYRDFVEFQTYTQAVYQADVEQRRLELQAMEQTLEKYKNLAESVKKITFENYILRRMPRIPPELAQSPLPEVPPIPPVKRPERPKPKQVDSVPAVSIPISPPPPSPSPVPPPVGVSSPTIQSIAPPPPSHENSVKAPLTNQTNQSNAVQNVSGSESNAVQTVSSSSASNATNTTSQSESKADKNVSISETTLLDQMYLVARFGILVGKSDGRLAKDERKVVRAFLAEEYGLNETLRKHIDPALEQIEKENQDEFWLLPKLKQTFERPFLERLYQWAQRIAAATGTPNAKEVAALQRYLAAFEIAPNSSSSIKPAAEPLLLTPEPASGLALAAKSGSASRGTSVVAPLAPSGTEASPRGNSSLTSGQSLHSEMKAPPPHPVEPPNYREILEIPNEAELSPELIRRKFNLLWERNDPKKVESMGKKFIELAEETRRSVREAAEKLMAPYGVPLEEPVAPPPTDLRHNPDLDDVFGI